MNNYSSNLKMSFWVWVLIIILVILLLLRFIFGYIGRPERVYEEVSKTEISQDESPKDESSKNETSKDEISEFTPDELENFYHCKRPFIGQGSYGERVCRKFLSDYFGLPFMSCRPDFLRNPETGQNLELDCYEASLRLAVEYQGRQHYDYVKKFHNSESDFTRALRLDKLKAQLCARLGIHLIRVPYAVPIHDIPTFIHDRLPEHLRNKKEIK